MPLSKYYRNVVILLTLLLVIALTIYLLNFSPKLDYVDQSNFVYLELNAVSSSIKFQKDLIVYSNWSDSISIYSLTKNQIIFNTKIIECCIYAKPILKKNLLFYPYSRQLLQCMDIITGKIIWKLNTKDCCSSIDFINDTTLIVSVKGYGIIVLNSNTGVVKYELKYDFEKCGLPDPPKWFVSFDNTNFYVSQWQANSLSSFKIIDGSHNWDYKSDNVSDVSQSIIFNDKIYIGMDYFDKGGQIVVLNKEKGNILYKVDCFFESFELPIIYDSILYLYNYRKNIYSFDLRNYQIRTLYNMSKETDIIGNQMYIVENMIYYSDCEDFLNQYSIKDNYLRRFKKMKMSLISTYNYKGKTYFITNIYH